MDTIASPTVDPEQTVPVSHRGPRRRPHLSIGMKLYLGMSAIAKRLACGSTASAQCHSIARFVHESIRRFERNAAAQPNRPAAILFRPRQDQSRSRAFVRQAFLSLYPMQSDGQTGSLPLAGGNPSEPVGRPYWILRPDISVWVAEASERAEALHVRQDQDRTIDFLGLANKGFAAGCFAAVESGTYVTAIAKRFLLRLATSAQGVFVRLRQAPTLFPQLGTPGGVRNNRLS
jgi:hypothetical protein